MKRLLMTILLVTVTSLLISAYAGKGFTKKSNRKEIRKEKRDERKLAWMHTPNLFAKAAFQTDFPGATHITWAEGDYFTEASFNDNGTNKTAYYDLNNELAGTTTTVATADLPARSLNYIHKHYPGYTIEKVILFDDEEYNDTDMFLFAGPFEDKDSYFAVLSNGAKKIILEAAMNGDTSFFENLNR